MFDRLSEDQRQALNIVREGHNIFIIGQGGTARMNNCLLSSIFQQGRVALGKWCIGPAERSPQDSRDGFFLYSAQASFSWPRVDLARLLRRAYSRSVWIISFEFVKVCGIRDRFCIWESFIGFYFYDPGMFIFRWSSNLVEKVVLNESMSAKMASRVSYLVYYYCI